MKSDLIRYYAQRAQEYERIYAKPERQSDLRKLHGICAGFRGREVLEISCGTGYWTTSLAKSASSVVACEINEEVLEIARTKDFGSAKVEFLQADSDALPDFDGRRFSGAFSGFWWSHVPRQRLAEFLRGLHAKLRRGASVMFIDNRFVEGSSTPVSRVDQDGNSFQQRRLNDGSVHEILKNFPAPAELEATVEEMAESVEVTLLEYFWVLFYRTR